MEQGPKSVNIQIISDSRGAGLEKTLSSITRDYNFSVTIRSGATFDILTNIAVAHKENFDYQIIVGGICSITTKEGRYVSYKRNEARKTQLKEQISSILDTLGTRVSVATIPPASITKYNAHKHHPQAAETSWLEQQQQLNEELREINSFIESENHRTGTQQVYLDKASTAKSVKRRGDNRTKRATVRAYSFTRLYDGIHADATLKKVWCNKIISAVRKATLAHSDDTSQESSHEEEWRDFKRRRI